MNESILLSDPPRFMEAVQEHDREARFRELATVEDRVVCESLRHGLFPGPDSVPSIIGEYTGDFLTFSVGDRRRVYEHLMAYVGNLGGDAATACVAFMMLEPDLGLASTATLDYASMAPLIDDDPMTRPRDALEMVGRGQAANPVAIVGGLLGLCDPRVCTLLERFRAAFSAEGV